MTSYIDLSVIIDGREGDNKYAQLRIFQQHIVAVQEDLDDKNCCYILLTNGKDLHVNCDYKQVLEWVFKYG